MPTDPRSRAVRLAIAAIVALAGLVWMGQGLGLLRGSSFMVDDVRWAAIGAACVAGAAALGWRTLRSTPDR